MARQIKKQNKASYIINYNVGIMYSKTCLKRPLKRRPKLIFNMFFKGYPLEAKAAAKNGNQSVHVFCTRQASFCHLGFISDPLIVSKFHNKTYDPKGHGNKIYTIVRGRETFYRRHTVPVTSCSEVKYVL